VTSTIRTPRKATAFDPQLHRLALVVIAGTLMTILDTTIVNVAITPLARDFRTSLANIQWVLTGYTLALSMAITLSGWAVERFGAKTTWITSLLVFITGSVLCGASWNVTSLIVFRVLQGAGGGMILPVGQTMLARQAGPERMTRVMSVIAVPAMLAPVLGPVIGGLIVDNLSWRWMFYVNVPLCAIALLLAFRILGPDTERRRAPVDVPGLLLLPPGLAIMIYGLSRAGSDNAAAWTWLAVGALFVAGFTLRALRTDHPLISVRAFRRRAFASSTVALSVYAGAIFGLMVVLPVYFQVVRGESPLRAGLLTAPIGIGAIITMSLSGRLTERIAARRVAAAGMAIVAAAALVYTQIGVATSLALLAVASFVAGLGHGTVLPPAMGAAYQGMPKPEIPAATATVNAAVRVGTSFGTAALAVVLQQNIRSRIPGVSSLSAAESLRGVHAHALLTSAFGATFWWVAAIAAVAIIPALLIPRAAAGR
jgi:EmrB/QacA subfamily drug resistance transporter